MSDPISKIYNEMSRKPFSSEYEDVSDIDILSRAVAGTFSCDKDSCDVDGDVGLRSGGLTSIPVKFDHVTGDFDCGDNNLYNLVNAPKQVDGNFDCGVIYRLHL